MQRLLAGLRAAGVRLMPAQGGVAQRLPFPGLEAFQSDDSSVFFGRTTDAQNIVDRMTLMSRFDDGPRLLLMSGPSGCGKSSLMRAGVLPLLESNLVGWAFAGLVRPDRALPQSPATTQTSSRQLVAVIAVDQMEELLNSFGDDRQREWLEGLGAWLSASDPPRQAVATIRTDALARFDTLAAALSLVYEVFAVPPLQSAQMMEAITGPCELAEIEIEPGLAQQMVEDCVDARALPLLAYTLREMYVRTTLPRRFTRPLYSGEIGGIRGSIERTMEAAVSGLKGNADDSLRRLFLRLVKVDENGAPVRRRQSLVELSQDERALADRLIPTVLISDAHAAEPTVEVAHEALFEQWPKLERWLAEYRPLLDIQRRMSMALAEWERTGAELTETHLNEFSELKAAGIASADNKVIALVEASQRALREKRLATALKAAFRFSGFVFVVGVLASLGVDLFKGSLGFKEVNTTGTTLRFFVFGLSVFAVAGGSLAWAATKVRDRGTWRAGSAMMGGLYASGVLCMTAMRPGLHPTTAQLLLSVIPLFLWLCLVGMSLLSVRQVKSPQQGAIVILGAIVFGVAMIGFAVAGRLSHEQSELVGNSQFLMLSLRYGWYKLRLNFLPEIAQSYFGIAFAVALLSSIVWSLVPMQVHRTLESLRRGWQDACGVWRVPFILLLSASLLMFVVSFAADWRDRKADAFAAAECAAATTAAWIDGHLEVEGSLPDSLESLAVAQSRWLNELESACKLGGSTSQTRLRHIAKALRNYTRCDRFHGWAAVNMGANEAGNSLAKVRSENLEAQCLISAPTGAIRATDDLNAKESAAVTFNCNARPWYLERSGRPAPVREDWWYGEGAPESSYVDEGGRCARLNEVRSRVDWSEELMRSYASNGVRLGKN